MRTKNLIISTLAAFTLLLSALVAVSQACLPSGCIDYSAGGGFTFDNTHGGGRHHMKNPNTADGGGKNGVLVDVDIGKGINFFDKSVTSLTAIRGFAHRGQVPPDGSRADANARVAKIQIWGWLDANGNGKADPIDAANGSTKWILLCELHPADDPGGETFGHVVGWNTNRVGLRVGGTSDFDDVLQANKNMARTLGGVTAETLAHTNPDGTIKLNPGEAWLLLIRVVQVGTGGTNLMDNSHDLDEQWCDGNGVGSGIDSDKYVDNKGHRINLDGTVGAQVIPDESIVSIYVPKN